MAFKLWTIYNVIKNCDSMLKETKVSNHMWKKVISQNIGKLLFKLPLCNKQKTLKTMHSMKNSQSVALQILYIDK